MEIAIVASLLAKGNMDINTSQRFQIISKPKLILLAAFVLFVSAGVFSQGDQKHYEILISDSLSSALKKEKLVFPDKLDSLTLIKSLNQISFHFQSKGYLLFDHHVEFFDEQKIHLKFDLGAQYKWALLDKGNLSDAIFLKLKSGQRIQSGSVFSPQALSKFFEDLIGYSEQNGFPFASIQLSELKFQDEGFHAKLNYQAGPRITYDSLLLTGDVKIKSAWLAAHLQVKPGEPFHQKSINAISERIERLPYLQLKSAPLLSFAASKSQIELPLANREASSFNGILGILPNEIEPDKILLTGQLQLDLHNLLSSGKRLSLHWQSLRPLTQLIDIQYYHPNLFYSNIDFSTSFYLLKEDSTFLSRIAQIGFALRPNKNSTILVYSAFRNSILLGNQNITLPSEIIDVDYSLNTLGISINHNRFKDFLKLGKGYAIHLDVSGGQKRIERNEIMPDDFFEDVKENSLQLFSSFDVEWGLPLMGQWMLSQRLRAGSIFNQNLFRNDLFRLGGLRSQRGFNENYFFASDFMLHNVELRFFAEQNTYFYAFTDWSIINVVYYNKENLINPLAIGLGLNLDTRAGILQMAFALGKLKDEKFAFDNTKFHFGYLARF